MTNESKVLKVIRIREDEAMTLKEISQKSGVSYKNTSPVLSILYSKELINRVGKGGKHNPYEYWRQLKSDSRGSIVTKNISQVKEVLPYNVKDGKLLEIALTFIEKSMIVVPIVNGAKLSANASDYRLSDVDWDKHNSKVVSVQKQGDKDGRISFKHEQMGNVLDNLDNVDRTALLAFYKDKQEIIADFDKKYSGETRLLVLAGLIKKSTTGKYLLTFFGTEICAQLFGVDINIDSGLRGTLSR